MNTPGAPGAVLEELQKACFSASQSMCADRNFYDSATVLGPNGAASISGDAYVLLLVLSAILIAILVYVAITILGDQD